MEFARQLPTSGINEKEDGSRWLQLPDARRPGWPAARLQQIMLRPCYNVLLQHLEDVTLGKEDIRGVLVTGTPGIGKSTFAYYFMSWLAKQRRAFVYDFGQTGGSRARLWFDYTREEVTVLQGDRDAFEGGCIHVPAGDLLLSTSTQAHALAECALGVPSRVMRHEH